MSSNYTLVRYQHGETKFEILVDPDKGLAYKRGEVGEVANVLIIDTIFTESSKGEKASESKLKDRVRHQRPDRGSEAHLPEGDLPPHREAEEGDD